MVSQQKTQRVGLGYVASECISISVLRDSTASKRGRLQFVTASAHESQPSAPAAIPTGFA